MWLEGFDLASKRKLLLLRQPFGLWAAKVRWTLSFESPTTYFVLTSLEMAEHSGLD